MKTLRFLGLALVIYGAVMLALLYSPWETWALNHSIASLVSATDRRAGNSIDGAVDTPMAIAGSAVMVFVGLWIGILVPRALKKFREGSGSPTQ